MNIKWFFAGLAAFMLLAGCASIGGDNGYLVKNLDDSNKSIALTNQGISAYSAYLVQQADYSKTAYVREYFQVALRYDPNNLRAKQYLDRVDNFKTGLVRDKLKTANSLLSKPKRKEDEDFALIVALQTANAIDPSNDSAAKLLKDNSAIQSTLAGTYLQRSKDAQAKASDPATPESARESAWIVAYDNAAKAVIVAPSNGQAKQQKSALQVEVGKAFDKHLASSSALVAKGKYDDARAELSRMGTLNAKLGGARASVVRASTYDLYFRWAKSLYAKGNIADADDKVDVAISAKRSDEALALKKGIAVKAGSASSANQEAAFAAALPEIDRLIAKGDLLGANRRIDLAAKLTKDKSKLDDLDARRAKLEDSLGGIYQAGVDAYRSENFKSAIDQLSVVVGIDAEYEQASDYLSKAKEKQKLLDQFSE